MPAVATRKRATTVDGQPVEFNWPYDLGYVPIGEKLLIAEYQRPLSSFVEKIVANYNGYLLLPLAVSEREPGELYAVVDGQTRAEAMERLAKPHAPAMIYRGMTLEQEADLFTLIMTQRRAMTSAARFNADRVRKDPRAVAIDAAVREAGFLIDPNQNGERNVIRAPASLEWMVEGGPKGEGHAARKAIGLEVLRTALRVISAAWPQLPDTAKSADMFKGLGQYLFDHPQVDIDKLIAQLAKVNPGTLHRRAEAFREGEDARGRSPVYLARAIEHQYASRAR